MHKSRESIDEQQKASMDFEEDYDGVPGGCLVAFWTIILICLVILYIGKTIIVKEP